MIKNYLVGWLMLYHCVSFAQQEIAINLNLVSANHLIQRITPNQSLLGVLAQIEKKFNVYFNYDPELIASKSLDEEIAISDDLIKTLDRVLNPLGLDYKTLGNGYYVIYSEIKSDGGKVVKPIREKSEKEKDNDGGEGITPDLIRPLTNQTSHVKHLYRIDMNVTGQVTDEQGVPLTGV